MLRPLLTLHYIYDIVKIMKAHRWLYGGALLATAGSLYLGGNAVSDHNDASAIREGEGVVYLDGQADQAYVSTGENTYVDAETAADYMDGIAVREGLFAVGALAAAGTLYVKGRRKHTAQRDLAVAYEEGGRIITEHMSLDDYLDKGDPRPPQDQ